MDHNEFLKLLSKSSRKQRNVSIFILIIGLLFVAGAVVKFDTMGTTGQIVLGSSGGICILLAVFMIVKAAKMAAEVKSGEHPLLKAMMTGDQNFVLWVYQHVTTVNNVQRTADHQVWIYSSSNKPIILFTKGSNAGSIIEYVSSKFPNALVGIH